MAPRATSAAVHLEDGFTAHDADATSGIRSPALLAECEIEVTYAPMDPLAKLALDFLFRR